MVSSGAPSKGRRFALWVQAAAPGLKTMATPFMQ